MKRLSFLFFSLILLLAITGCESLFATKNKPKPIGKNEVLHHLSQALQKQQGYQLTYQQQSISKNEDKAKSSNPVTSKRNLQFHYQDAEHFQLQIEESIQTPPLDKETKFQHSYTVLGSKIYENKKLKKKQELKQYITKRYLENDPLVLNQHPLFQQMPTYLQQATMKTTSSGYEFTVEENTSKTIKELMQLKEPQAIGDKLKINVTISHENFLPSKIQSNCTYHTIEPVQKRTTERTDQWTFQPSSETIEQP
jgi:hypothetical protein